ncbi:MAG: D-alanyl-D-alanine carboxypeptidase family protein [Sporomusaceae bacterium]|nr:D-alanyl-D-alanine carboxypeptidase family protein [Sporomusaceae bacterium]
MAWHRTTLAFFAVFIGIWLTAWPEAAAAPPQIKARAGVLIDAKTGDVLFEKNSREHNAPASTTKIMTAILAIESGRLDNPVRVSLRAAATRGSSMHLYAGQVLSLHELLSGLLLRSGNDAAVAIAEHLAGTNEAFVAQMNERARALGATDTHFRNPHGLSAPGHYSSAYDLALLARFALADPTFAALVGSKEISIEWLDRRGREKDVNLRNTNKLLWMLEEADGVKTGTTGEAGPCLVSSATRGNHKLIAVVLNDHSRWYDSMQLLKFGFDNYDLYEYADQGALIATLPVESGLAATVDAVAAAPAALVLPAADYPRVTVEVDLPKKIKAPVYQGQKIGEIIFFVGDKAEKTVDIVASREISERTAVKTFLHGLLRTFRLLAGWGVL